MNPAASDPYCGFGRRICAGLLAVVLSAGLLSACGEDPQAADQRTTKSLRTAFAPFRSPPEGLPPRVTRILREPFGGARLRLAQRLRTTAGPAVWAVPGKGILCLISQEGAHSEVLSSCTRAYRAVEHGAFLTSLSPEPVLGLGQVRRFIAGVVPDGTRRVRIHTPGSGTKTARITDGTVALLDNVADPPERFLLLP